MIARSRRLLAGLRMLRRSPVDVAGSVAAVRAEVADRDARFLRLLDDMVWSVPGSPYRPLLAHAGIERGDVRELVARDGLEPALEALRDGGVYVAYDEWLGKRAAQRGSATFDLDPGSFANPEVPPDQFGSTSGTRSGGTTVGMSFANLRHGAELELVRMAAWGCRPGPTAVWMPVLPSGAGLNTVLRHATMGIPVDAWFSQIAPTIRAISVDKRAANLLLPAAARAAGLRVPRAIHVPTSDPDPVLDWCVRTLRSSGRAMLSGYASSMVAMSRRAIERGERLDGLMVTTSGEPLTRAKASAIRSSGATVVNRYAFMQFGAAGVACPECADEELHVWDGDAAVVSRPVTRPDGAPVTALLWTSLDPRTRGVLINVENDDYGAITRDADACSCLLGELGMRTRLTDVRGMSKVVAGGVTLSAERFEELADSALPARFGGGPGDWQFAEIELGERTLLTLRVSPRVGLVDEPGIRTVVRDAMRLDEVGVLADEVWGALTIERADPVAAQSGKVLPYEALVAGEVTGGGRSSP